MTSETLPPKLSSHQKFVLSILSASSAARLETLHSYLEDELGEVTDGGFSRSLKNLEERNLIIRYPRASELEPNQTRLPKSMLKRGYHTKWIIPTIEGQHVGEELRERISDGRFDIYYDLEGFD